MGVVVVCCLLAVVLPVSHSGSFYGRGVDSPLRVKRQTVFTNDQQAVVRRKLDCGVADLVFVLDSSGSIGLDNWYKITNFTVNIINAFDIGQERVRAGVLYYGNEADVAFYLNSYYDKRQILDEIRRIPWKDQETNTSGAIRMMRTQMFTPNRGDRPDVPNIGIVITDGESNRDADLTIPEANDAKADGIIMFALGIGDKISLGELIGIANSPKDKYVFRATDFDTLKNIEVVVENAACEAAAECRQNADVVFLLDSSGSVGEANFDLTKDFVKIFIREFDIDGGRMRIAAVRFADGEQPVFYFNSYSKMEDIIDAVDSIRYTEGRTNTAGALRLLREQMFQPSRGARLGTNHVAVIFTDGGSNDFQETIKMAKEARLEGITILVVAVGGWVNWLEVNEIASDPDSNNVIKVASFARFGEIQTQLRKTICNDDDTCSPNPCRNGGQCRGTIGQFSCTCPDGYAGRFCELRCDTQVDLVIALDSSDSIRPDKYNKLLDFGKDLARSLNIGESKTRMGVATYATDALIRFQMNRYRTQQDIADATSFPYMSGSTNTAAVLRIMRQNMYLPQNGDRNNARNVAVVVTDGHSTDRKATLEQSIEFQKSVGSVLAVAVGAQSIQDKMELRAMASDPDDRNLIMVGDYDNLINVTSDVVKAVCNTLKSCQSSPCQRGGKCVEKMNGFDCECQQGSTGALCERAADGTLDIGILIDVSGSIRRERFPLVIDYVRNIVKSLEIRPGRTRVGIASFADNSQMEFFLNTYERKEHVLQAIEYIKFREGKTNTASGLEMLRTQLFNPANGDRANAPNIAVIITDGKSNVNTENTIPEAMKARADGIYIIVSTVGESRNQLEIRGLASDPVNQNVVSVDRYQQLNTLVDKLVKTFTNDQNECNSNPCRNGGTCLDGIGMFACRCRNQFAGTTCDRRCTAQQDIVFVVDVSGSLGNMLEWSQRLVKQIVSGLNFNGGRTRVGLVTFQNDPIVQFPLNEFDKEEDILIAMTFARRDTVKGTNTASAFRAMRREMFTSQRGDRPGANDVAIVLTDGLSNVNRQETIPEAEAAARDGIRMMAVGVGNQINRAEIEGIASPPKNNNAHYISREYQILGVADLILDELCR